MTTLSTQVASELALEIYGIIDEKLAKKLLKRPEFLNNSGKSNTQGLTAEIGLRLINTQDAFGLCAMGGNSYKNDIFIMFRGTTKLKADWLTNARVGVQASSSGWPVHTGFNSAFTSMLPQIKDFLKNSKPTATIHCIGHSLGGAVASITANWLANNTSQAVKLYTFGAPKPGLAFFANSLTRKVGKTNIFRTYHATDPVPMVPLFPFMQPPFPGYGHYVPSSESIMSAEAHDMRKYVKSVSKLSWKQLERRRPPYTVEDAVKSWLESKLPVHSGSPKIWEWINAGLIYVLTKISGLIAGSVQSVFMGAMTVADTLAWALSKGLEFSKHTGLTDISKWVLLLMNKIMQALGMGIPDENIDMTRAFLQNILSNLVSRTNDEARKAIAHS